MVCCVDQGAQDSENTAQNQGVPENSSSLSKIFLFSSLLNPISFTLTASEHIDDFTQKHFILEDNHRYLKLSSFLI